MSELSVCGIYGDYDFYDHGSVEKLHNLRSKKKAAIYKRIAIKEKKGSLEARSKALRALVKHLDDDEIYKEKASKSGYYWY
ncbi:hypothetical protein N9Y92_04200 [Chlamydiales bacterium]|nr:hypothetical protein [Chlamydiales bacterium]